MKPVKMWMGALVALAVVATSGEAFAWGQRAQQSISFTAMQVLAREYPAVVKGYERDVLRGAEDGHRILEGIVPLNSDAEVIAAVGSEIQLLREVRKYGVGSYYAYRLGVLSALVADVIVPYGFAWNEREQEVQTAMFRDIDEHLGKYGYDSVTGREFIRDSRAYFRAKRDFYDEALRIIADDYRRGAGYGGYLNQAGQAYFVRAVNAVADAWYTVLTPRDDVGDVRASPTMLTWYFAREIEYLLTVKRNYEQANKSYEYFEQVNPGLPESYERLGDLYYAFGSDNSEDRGVREWRHAFELGGTTRTRVARKLSKHFMTVGDDYLQRGQQPGSDDGDLPSALQAFEQALTYDRTNQQAADSIQLTNRAINERQKRYEMNLNIIATAERVEEEATRALASEDYGSTITTYQQARNLYGTVDDYFPPLRDQAKQRTSNINKQITETINKVFEKANTYIEDGDRMVEDRRYDDAVLSYQRVPTLLATLPADMNQPLLETRTKLLEDAARKVDEAKEQKVRFEQAQQDQAATGAPR